MDKKVIMIIIGVFALLAVIGLILYFVLRNKRDSKYKWNTGDDLSDYSTTNLNTVITHTILGMSKLLIY